MSDNSSVRARNLVIVRGAGDLATGTIVRLHRAGYAVAALETETPSAIRRTVAFAEAVYDGSCKVEGIEARLVRNPEELLGLVKLVGEDRPVPILVDPDASSLERIQPEVLIDAMLAKRNLGTNRGMAALVVGLGPGFEAGEDVDVVIETNRGHDLGRVLWKGRAEPDTGIPGELGGASADRVVRAEASGSVIPLQRIGDLTHAGQIILYIEKEYEHFIVYSKIDGILRGLIRSSCHVEPGMKIADIDPRGKRENCFTISDKARAIGGAVLEALLSRGITP